MKQAIAVLLAALTLAWTGSAQAANLVLPPSALQGALVVGQVDPGAKVVVDGRSVRVSAEGLFLIGLGRDASAPVVVEATAPDGSAIGRELTIETRTYEIQRIDGLPSKQVTPDPATLKRIRAENALIGQARKEDTALTGFANGFAWPVTGRISGVFGSQRILNGEPRSPHRGVDIAAPAGTPVRAMAAGRISLVHPDMFYTGRTVMIDHGHGLSSIYVHMRDILVADGQEVAQGDAIGTVGQSGRATGPHLHWGVNLLGAHLDPALLVGPMPQP